jgi:small conductance mechanosensitive channel
VDRVMEVLHGIANDMRREPEFGPHIHDAAEMLGVDSLGDSAVVIKFFNKTRPSFKWPVKRELLRRIKRRFDELGIEIPFPHRTVYHRTEEAVEGETTNDEAKPRIRKSA